MAWKLSRKSSVASSTCVALPCAGGDNEWGSLLWWDLHCSFSVGSGDVVCCSGGGGVAEL